MIFLSLYIHDHSIYVCLSLKRALEKILSCVCRHVVMSTSPPPPTRSEQSDAHKGLIHIFFAQRSTKKVRGVTDGGLKPRYVCAG